MKKLKTIKKELQFLKIKPDYRDQLNLSENLKNLSKQLALVKIENIKKDKSKNIIKERQIGKIKIREQLIKRFSTKRTKGNN